MISFINRTFILFLIIFTFSIKANAQIVFKDQISFEDYQNHSKFIDLLQENINSINIRDSTSFFIVPNYAINFLDKNLADLIFIQKNSDAITAFLSNHRSNNFYTFQNLYATIEPNVELNLIRLRSGNIRYFQKNGDYILLSDHFKSDQVTTETNILKSVTILSTISFNFLQGIIKY